MTKIIWKILSKTFTDTLNKAFWKFVFGSSIVSSLGLIKFFKNFLDTDYDTAITIFASIVISLYILRFTLILIKNISIELHNRYRESKYGDAIILLKNAFSEIHYYRTIAQKSDKDFIETLQLLCDNIQELFSKKNLCDCSVSIKVAVEGTIDANVSLKNLCRDSKHTDRDDHNYRNTNHTIIGNTAFQKVLNNVSRKGRSELAYINNSISTTTDYENTSKEVYSHGILPYDSEIVVPIIPSKRNNTGDIKIAGFLCIDCSKKNKFDSKYDIPLIEGVADGVYDMLMEKVG